jgi:hypothetical protein
MNRVTVIFLSTLLATGVGVPLWGQHHGHDTVTGGGVFPPGWSVWPDSGGMVEQVKLVTMGKDYHLTLGTSAIVYRQADQGTSSFHTLANFTQTKPTGEHPEGYGLFYGGKDLGKVSQQYIYFLVRGDGQYLIKRRNGEEVIEIKPWTEHPAIKKVNANGQATNLLAIEVKQKSNQVLFMANGQTVDSITATADDLEGVIGIRANHDLDLHIGGFAIHR